MAVAVLVLLSLFAHSNANEEAFDVRQHLSTVTRYGVVKDVAGTSFVPSDVPSGCTPIHLNLVARHGTRNPTEKRIKELKKLEDRLKALLREAEENKLSWLRSWKSPWKGKGGELIDKGEEELYKLGIRIREKFPNLFIEDYHPDIYTINATQIPRASASAVAFGMGLFSGNGSLGPGRHRAFAVTSESLANDTVLRFHDCCQNYKNDKDSQKSRVKERLRRIFREISSALVERYNLNFTEEDTSSLWFLCKQQASLLDITDQACALFNSSEVDLLEWTDDVELFILKGYGKSINYQMGVPLLEDVVQSMDRTIQAREENHVEKARLRFAHAETVVPFLCLLGLFREGPEIQRNQSLECPPKPPEKRNWRGSTVAPFAVNIALVLYSCPANTSSEYFVQVLHNEHPIPMPGCNGSDFCAFEVFKERIVDPHLKNNYTTVCTAKLDKPKPQTSKFSVLNQWLLSFFSSGSDDKRSHEEQF
ncbi:hypothetical protein UlMin_005078 [Ulmus minor]